MEMPDLVAMARAAVLSERYDVQLDSRGDPRLAVHGGDLVCKFLHREGRAHVQKARAELMAQAPELAEAVRWLRSALGDLIGTLDSNELIKMKEVIPLLAGADEDGNGGRSLAAVNALLDTSGLFF